MKNCVLGKPCGNTCIKKDRTCYVDPLTNTPKLPICNCGKPCGKTCINKNRRCHLDATMNKIECIDIVIPVNPDPITNQTNQPRILGDPPSTESSSFSLGLTANSNGEIYTRNNNFDQPLICGPSSTSTPSSPSFELDSSSASSDMRICHEILDELYEKQGIPNELKTVIFDLRHHNKIDQYGWKILRHWLRYTGVDTIHFLRACTPRHFLFIHFKD